QIYLSPGDTIELLSSGYDGERARVDYIDLLPTTGILETYVEGSEPTLSENLFTNGDFSSNLSGWNIVKGSVQAVTTDAYEGMSLSLEQHSIVDQSVDIFGGQTYEFSAIAKSTGESWGGLGVIIYDANWQKLDERQLTVTTADWTTYQDSFVTAENARYASIWTAASEHNGQLLIDNVLFQEKLAVSADNTELEEYTIHQTKPWDDGLVAHWSFDEVDANRAQDSINSLNARLFNMEATDVVQGMVGSALRFDGANEKFVVEEASSLHLGEDNADFSIAFWLRLEEDATGNWRTVMDKGDVWGEHTFSTSLHDDSNRLFYGVSTTESQSEGGHSQRELAVNQWTHVSYTKSGNQLSLYLDGQLDSSVTLQGEVNINNAPLRISEDNLEASIDELKIYNRALTTEDLKSLSLYNADVLEGGQGQDTLYGDEGNDQLYGESENAVELAATKSFTGDLDGDFDGTQAQVFEHQDSMLLNNGTLSFSFSTDNTSSQQGLFSKDSAGYNGGGHLTIWVNNGRLELRLQNESHGNYNLISGPIEAGQVHDVAVTFGDRGLEMWVDGNLAATDSYQGGIGTNSGSGNRDPIVLGASQMHSTHLTTDKLSEYFTGTLYNVRLFESQLDSSIIAQIPTAAPSNAVFEALLTSDESNNDVLVGGKGHDNVYGNIGDDILYGDDANVLTDGIRHNGSLYLLTQEASWHDAQAQAKLWGGNLITLNNSEEEDWVRQTFGETEGFWIGITDTTVEGQFVWVSGEEVEYTNWAPGEPNNDGDQDYGYMNFGGSKQWDDARSSSGERRGVIEIKLPEESGNDVMVGGIGNDVLYGELGDDVLDGSNARAKGAFELDILAGGHGADRFIVGNADSAYYLSNGNFDYALIKDFNAAEDTVQLHGSAADYTQQQQGNDTYLYYSNGNSELVAILENTNNINLSQGFSFV
ncbi:MAG: LamG-like jellyroll fold domain-containing protein, partial [Cyanobacteria bacterium J06632_3]